MKFKSLKIAGMSLGVLVSVVMISNDYVFAQEAADDYVIEHEAANGGAPLKNERDSYISEEEQIELFQKSRSQMSESQKRDLASKMEIIKEEKELSRSLKTNLLDDNIKELEDDDLAFDTEEDILSAGISYPKKILKVKHFEQANGYYCDPATVKQTLHYLTGKSPTQKSIARVKFE